MGRNEMLERRRFVKLCASAVASISASPALLAGPGSALRPYKRAKLVDASDRPLAPQDLAVGESYLFYYPYVSTPCFLMNLGKSAAKGALLETKDGATYEWQGGVGPDRSLVAFSAICAHKMSHPARDVSFINYRHQKVSFKNAEKESAERAQIISCCSERSVYDPTDGARVLGGPAPQPLAAIALAHDDNALYATGTYGGEMFETFFEKFAFRLALEFETSDVRDLVAEAAVVTPMSEYGGAQILC